MLARVENTMWGRELNYDHLDWIGLRAVKFGLNGIVYFREDGSIKVIAEGEEEDLEKLESTLDYDNFPFRIENFSLTWHKPTGEFQDFTVLEKEPGKHH